MSRSNASMSSTRSDELEVTSDAGAQGRSRKQLGAWYTPPALVELVVEHTVTGERFGACTSRPVRVLDPACGDARFLEAVANQLDRFGTRCELVGVDIDPDAAAAARGRCPVATIVVADALEREWDEGPFDLVIGNPPFLSQLASTTARGGSSRHGGGPYADAAVEFLALAGELVAPDGRVALVLPRSVLSARDAGPVRRALGERASIHWSWSSDEKLFAAEVLTCAVSLDFGASRPVEGVAGDSWGSVITSGRGIPEVPDDLDVAGTLVDRARLNANFRDEYYGMVPAVGDHDAGPPLVTSGLIDPGVMTWGTRPVRFAKRRFHAPRVDVAALDDAMQRWAEKRLVPKVLIANQTAIIEAVCDPVGEWLPGVPVVAAYPSDGSAETAWEIGAVLTSPVASAWAWHRSAGTGMSAGTIRLGPALLAELPWPQGDLSPAVRALRGGDVRVCAQWVDAAYGFDDHGGLYDWWTASLDRIEARRRPTA
jgi:SAM-dependent methyltransferase